MEKLELRGIQRFKDAINTNPEGSCDEIINLRRKDGQWVLIYQKDEEYDLTGIADLVLYIDWYKHPVTDDSWFIAVMNHAFAAQTIELVKATVPSSTTILTLDINETVTKVYHFGYFLIVATDVNVYYLKFDRDTDTYVLLPDLEHGLYSVSSTSHRQLSIGNISLAALPDVTNPETITEGLTLAREKINEYEEDGYFNGHTYFRIAFKLVDGNVIMPTGPYYYHIGMTGWGVSKEYTEDLTPNIINYRGVSGHNVINIKIPFLSKPLIELGFTAAQITNIQLYEGLVKSIVVYMSKPFTDRDFNVTDVEDLEFIVDKNYPGPGYDAKLYVYPYKDSVALNKYLNDTATYYEVHEESIIDLVVGGSITVTAGDISTIETKPTLPVDDFSAHKIFSNVMYEYNSRLHIGSPTIKLNDGFNMSYIENEKFITPPATSNMFQPLVDMTDPIYVGDTYPFAPATLYSIVTLKINNKELTVISEHDKLSVYRDGVTSSRHVLFNTVLSYPDSRATSIQYVVLDGGAYYDISGVVELRSHEYLNYAFSNSEAYKHTGTYIDAVGATVANSNIGLRVFRFRKYLLSFLGAVVPVTVENYIDSNRVQASSLNTFLHYPADNSYRIGKTTNSIVGIMSQAVPMSEGQYGKFPLMVFSTEGIFSLEQGSGDILYESIQPVSLDVCNNTDSVIAINGGILFSSEKGLMVLYGRKVDEISRPIEGDPKVDINTDANYISAMDGSDLVVNLDGSISTVNFTTYISGAIIAYDHKNDEIIVSNDTYSYSYIFSILEQVWYKTDQVFSDFITDHPDWSGIRSGKIYNLSVEDTTVYPDFMVKTNPFKFGSNILKSIERLVLRFNVDNSAYIRGNNFTSLYLYGSLDGKVWALISGVMPDHSDSQIKQNFLMLRKVRTTARYFIVFAASSSASIAISDMEFDIIPKIANKLR